MQSSFYWGYMTLQIPGGQLVHMFGARRLITGALAINSFASFMFPWIAYYVTIYYYYSLPIKTLCGVITPAFEACLPFVEPRLGRY